MPAVLLLLLVTAPVTLAVLPETLPPHPRIVLTPARILQLQGLIAGGDADLLSGLQFLTRYTDQLMGIPPLQCQPFEPSRSVDSYPMMTRIQSLGLVYKLTGNVSIGRRAVAELWNLTIDPHWGATTDPRQEGWIMHAYNPLASGAMLYAAAVGFDWLYDILTPTERTSVASAIMTMGVTPFACCYDANSPPPGFPACQYLDWCGFTLCKLQSRGACIM